MYTWSMELFRILSEGIKRKTVFFGVLSFSIISAVLIASVSQNLNNDISFVLHAKQLLTGHISLDPTNNLPLGDIAQYNGKFYLYFGLLPSLFLIPFVLIYGLNTPQLLIGVTSLLLSYFAVYKISKSFSFQTLDSHWLSLFYVFSTVLFSLSVINISAYQVQAFGSAFLLLSLSEYFGKKRPLLIGLFLGFALLTRFTLVLAVVFFLLEYLYKRLPRQALIKLLIPVVACSMIFGLYNHLRFDSFIESGYNHLRGVSYPISSNLEYGYIHPIHIPANLYSFFLMPPEPVLTGEHGFVLSFPYLKANPWGMAIWYTSPLFLYLLFRFKKGTYSVSAVTTSLLIAIPVFLYFSIGFAQFGYRYAIDFLPFLFLLLLPSLKPKLTVTGILLIIVGVLFNCLFITSLWGKYPHFGI